MGIKIFKPTHKRVATGHREFNPERDKRQALYRGNDTWRKFSSKFLETNPVCYCCNERSSVTDHLVAHKGDKTLFEKTGNHVALCAKCHNTVTSKFDKNYRPGESVEEKTKWMNEVRARNEILQNKKFPAVKVISYYDK